MKKWIGWTIGILILVLSIFIYWRYYFVYASGTKAGTLNTFQEKGFLFKTYEGKIIQSGFRANVQSNEFDFSVTDTAIARVLLDNSGLEVRVHYKRYLSSLPWRGTSAYLVDSIYEIKGLNGETVIKAK
ncbi:MAG: hypothetical protein ACOVQE_03170 [Chitinophagaceae bacterium]